MILEFIFREPVVEIAYKEFSGGRNIGMKSYLQFSNNAYNSILKSKVLTILLCLLLFPLLILTVKDEL